MQGQNGGLRLQGELVERQVESINISNGVHELVLDVGGQLSVVV